MWPTPDGTPDASPPAYADSPCCVMSKPASSSLADTARPTVAFKIRPKIDYFLGEKAGCKRTPNAADAVNAEHVKRVIVAEF